MLGLPSAVRIFVCTQPTDMRRSFDGLGRMVDEIIREDPLGGHLFVFISRSRDGPKGFLDAYRGCLQADAYAGYDRLYEPGGVAEVACWAHARRKFYECERSDPKRAVAACAWIKRLYRIEEECRDSSNAERAALRKEKSARVLDEFKAWLERERRAVLPKSPIGGAVSYTLSNWDALCRYTAEGRLTIDNNRSERALRRVAVGRKNWMFAGSDRGGHTAAVLYSLVASARDHGLDPWSYLRNLLIRCARNPSGIESLLPDRWAPPDQNPA